MGMSAPLAKSMTSAEKIRRLHDVVDTKDSLAILISADPDALASAMALKRIFWHRAKATEIYRINKIDRADNLALIQLLNIDNQHIRNIKKSRFTKWALVDSQPAHNELFEPYAFDIIIDHHPLTTGLQAQYIDIKEEYGANATIMTEYLKASRITPSPRLATALFCGIKSDTNNFLRDSASADMNAFRYLYEYVNMSIVKKIESSEITIKTLSAIAVAIENLRVSNGVAFVHMGPVDNPDTLVIIADFFIKLAEVIWSISSGVFEDKLIVCICNAGFRRDAGKFAHERLGDLGRAGGHANVARAEIPLREIEALRKNKPVDHAQFLRARLLRQDGFKTRI